MPLPERKKTRKIPKPKPNKSNQNKTHFEGSSNNLLNKCLHNFTFWLKQS